MLGILKLTVNTKNVYIIYMSFLMFREDVNNLRLEANNHLIYIRGNWEFFKGEGDAFFNSDR